MSYVHSVTPSSAVTFILAFFDDPIETLETSKTSLPLIRVIPSSVGVAVKVTSVVPAGISI